MDRQTEGNELFAAWRALTGTPTGEGWSTIPVARGGPCSLLAGRRFPGNEEALLIGFSNLQIPSDVQLPQAHGFSVSRARIGKDHSSRVWIGLCRKDSGSLDLFAKMAEDVVATLGKLHDADDMKLFRAFLARISAWQNFMQRGGDYVLSQEAEVGLFGELALLLDLLQAGLLPDFVVEAWQGPLDGIHDFVFGTGAIEVKTTASPNGFPATISSLDQLDDSLVRPLFLAAIRLSLGASGRTLSEQVAAVRELVRLSPVAETALETLLLRAGFLDAARERYSRRFSRIGNKMLLVEEDFPRLTRMNLPIEIRNARYEIDLDLTVAKEVAIFDALSQLGVVQQWN